jgi:hypothetical protein
MDEPNDDNMDEPFGDAIGMNLYSETESLTRLQERAMQAIMNEENLENLDILMRHQVKSMQEIDKI